jgi:hypothetical protein
MHSFATAARNPFFDWKDHLTGIFRLRPALIRAARFLPSMPPLFHKVKRHAGHGETCLPGCPKTPPQTVKTLLRYQRSSRYDHEAASALSPSDRSILFRK